jgi:HK97 family phage prohead protease
MELTDRRRLPDEVRARLPQGVGTGPFEVVTRGKVFEARTTTKWELRASQEELDKALRDRTGDIPIVGYSTSYEQPYEVMGGPSSWGWNEVMATGSWAKTIAQGHDIRMLVNHDGIPLARTASTTMKLTSDDLGVLVDATLDMRSGLARDVASAVWRGDMSQMSCAFEVIEQTWSPDYLERRILEVRGFDVSVVNFPANESTMVMVAGSEPPGSSAGAATESKSVDVCPECGAGMSNDICPGCGYGSSRSAKRGMSLTYAQALADQLRLSRV